MNSFNLLLALLLVTLMLPSCIEFGDRSSAEKRYLKKGATPKEAKQKAFEDEVFAKANERPADEYNSAQRKEADDAFNGR